MTLDNQYKLALRVAAEECYKSEVIDTLMEPLIVGYGLEWANKEDWILATVSDWLNSVDKETVDEDIIYIRAIEKWGAITQMHMLMTECGELIAALGRFAVQGRDNRKEVEGELADVDILLSQHKELFDWKEEKQKKLKRLAGILDGSIDHPHA